MISLLLALLLLVSGFLGSQDVDGTQCFEDEYVVAVISSWPTTPDAINGHNQPQGWLACVPIDNTRRINHNYLVGTACTNPATMGGGFILVEDDYGNMGRADFATTSALMLRWSEIATTPDLQRWSEPFDPEEDLEGFIPDYSSSLGPDVLSWRIA